MYYFEVSYNLIMMSAFYYTKTGGRLFSDHSKTSIKFKTYIQNYSKCKYTRLGQNHAFSESLKPTDSCVTGCIAGHIYQLSLQEREEKALKVFVRTYIGNQRRESLSVMGNFLKDCMIEATTVLCPENKYKCELAKFAVLDVPICGPFAYLI